MGILFRTILLLQILMLLYDQDVLTEDAIMRWNSSPSRSYLAMLTPQQMRAKVISITVLCYISIIVIFNILNYGWRIVLIIKNAA